MDAFQPGEFASETMAQPSAFRSRLISMLPGRGLWNWRAAEVTVWEFAREIEPADTPSTTGSALSALPDNAGEAQKVANGRGFGSRNARPPGPLNTCSTGYATRTLEAESVATMFAAPNHFASGISSSISACHSGVFAS